MNNPRVSVFIPVYNGGLFLAAAIESILAQSFSDFELLIIDDGSNDESLDIIKSYKDQRIRLLLNGVNKGISYTRNRGIKEARGEFLALLDADDIAFSKRLERQLLFLESNPEVVGCGSHAMVIDSTGKLTGEILKVPVKENEVKTKLLFQNVFVNSTVMYRLSVLKNSNYYNGLCEDYEIAIQLNACYNLANIDEVLGKYRNHSFNISKVFSEKMSLAEMYVIKRIHQQLGIDEDSKLISLHHTILTGERGTYSLMDYEQLLLTLREANNEKQLYPTKEFNKELFTVFYNRIRVHNNRRGIRYFFDSYLFQWEYVSFKMLRRIIKQSIWFERKD